MISFPISSPIYPWHPLFPSPHTPSRPAYYAIFSARVHLHTIGYSYRFSTLIAYVVNPPPHPIPSIKCFSVLLQVKQQTDRGGQTDILVPVGLAVCAGLLEEHDSRFRHGIWSSVSSSLKAIDQL